MLLLIGVALILALGAAMLMMGGAVWLVAAGMSMLIDSITALFSGDALTIEKAGAFFVLAAGIGALAVALMFMSLSAVGALIAVAVIGALSYIVIQTAEALANVDFSGIATDIMNISTALASLDTGKLDELKNAAFWLMAASLGGPIRVEFGPLDITGTIDLKGEDGSQAIDLSQPNSIFISELKNLIFESFDKDKNSGLLPG